MVIALSPAVAGARPIKSKKSPRRSINMPADAGQSQAPERRRARKPPSYDGCLEVALPVAGQRLMNDALIELIQARTPHTHLEHFQK